ncbi:MAG: TrmH family RNA methyltransferase [Caldithrix sp.]|nr:TrmH family RNA methyltransferase [Caldithrix sp.]
MAIRKLTFDEIFSRQPGLEELKTLRRVPLYALIQNIRSMHNVGSIFRTSDGVRLKHLFLTGFTPTPPRKEIDKTALGATDSVPWSYEKDGTKILRQLKKKEINLVVVEHTNKSIPYTDVNYEFPMCLIMGNEVEGISQEIIKQADVAVDIPMLGMKQSLNVSVAYGIIIYHILSRYLENNTNVLQSK